MAALYNSNAAQLPNELKELVVLFFILDFRFYVTLLYHFVQNTYYLFVFHIYKIKQ